MTVAVMPNQPIDLVALVALLLTAIGATQISGYVAPYLLVLGVAWFAAWAAAGDADTAGVWTRWQTARFIILRAALTGVCAVGLAVWLNRMTGLEWRWSVTVIAAVLAYIGPREAIQAAWAKLLSRFGGAPPRNGDQP